MKDLYLILLIDDPSFLCIRKEIKTLDDLEIYYEPFAFWLMYVPKNFVAFTSRHPLWNDIINSNYFYNMSKEEYDGELYFVKCVKKYGLFFGKNAGQIGMHSFIEYNNLRSEKKEYIAYDLITFIQEIAKDNTKYTERII